MSKTIFRILVGIAVLLVIFVIVLRISISVKQYMFTLDMCDRYSGVEVILFGHEEKTAAYKEAYEDLCVKVEIASNLTTAIELSGSESASLSCDNKVVASVYDARSLKKYWDELHLSRCTKGVIVLNWTANGPSNMQRIH